MNVAPPVGSLDVGVPNEVRHDVFFLSEVVDKVEYHSVIGCGIEEIYVMRLKEEQLEERADGGHLFHETAVEVKQHTENFIDENVVKVLSVHPAEAIQANDDLVVMNRSLGVVIIDKSGML